jgi:hypothetical protein
MSSKLLPEDEGATEWVPIGEELHGCDRSDHTGGGHRDLRGSNLVRVELA